MQEIALGNCDQGTANSQQSQNVFATFAMCTRLHVLHVWCTSQMTTWEKLLTCCSHAICCGFDSPVYTCCWWSWEGLSKLLKVVPLERHFHFACVCSFCLTLWWWEMGTECEASVRWYSGLMTLYSFVSIVWIDHDVVSFSPKPMRSQCGQIR